MTNTEPNSPALERPSILIRALPALAVLLAVVMRLNGLTDRELWIDEACTHHWVDHLFDLSSSATPWHEPAHLPYFLLLRILRPVLGGDAFGLRLPSVAFGVINVILVGRACRQWFGKRAGITASILGAVHPLHVYYSQEARAYAPWALLITVATIQLVHAAIHSRRRSWIAYGATVVLAVLTHYYTLIWLPASIAGAVLAPNRRRFIRQWLVAHAGIGLVLVPIGIGLIRPYVRTGAEDWKARMWRDTPPALAIPKSLWALMPAGGYPRAYLAPLAVAADASPFAVTPTAAATIRWLPSVLALVAVVMAARGLRGAADSCSSARASDDAATRARFFWFLLLLPLGYLGVAWLTAWWLGRGYLAGRYDIAAWSAVIMLLAAALDQLGRLHARPLAPTIIGVAMVTCGGATIAGVHALPIENSTRERAARVVSNVGEHDFLVSVGMYRWFMVHEWDAAGFAPEIRSFPAIHDQQMCWRNVDVELKSLAALADEAAALATEIAARIERGQRVWLVAATDPADRAWTIDEILFRQLRQSQIEAQPIDEWAGLAELIVVAP